jgi:methyl-accepting chemotaxis protein
MAGRLRRWTLRTKVVFHIVVLGGLSAGLLAAIYLTTQRSIIRAFGVQQAELAGALVENGIFLLKKCGRVQDTQSEIHSLVATNEAIGRIRILTVDGRVFASTRPEEIGTRLTAAEKRPLEEMLAGGPRRRILPTGSASLTSLSLVANKPACFGCHDPGRRINGFLEVEFESSGVRAMVWKSQGKGIVLALAALGVLIFIVLRLFERLINRPIAQLREGMARVREGDLSVRWPVRTEDEIGSLTASLNAMVGTLQAANAEIESGCGSSGPSTWPPSASWRRGWPTRSKTPCRA